MTKKETIRLGVQTSGDDFVDLGVAVASFSPRAGYRGPAEVLLNVERGDVLECVNRSRSP